jgi:hypothetical protein
MHSCAVPLPLGQRVDPEAFAAIDKFSGQEDAYTWLQGLLGIAELYGWSQDTCLKVAKARLKDAAQRWARRHSFNSWDAFAEQFLLHHGETRESAIARLDRCYQHRDEAPQVFADRFWEAAERAGRREDDALMYQFIQRLQPELRMEVTRQRVRSINDAVSFCNYWLGLHNNEFLAKRQQKHHRHCLHNHNTYHAMPPTDRYDVDLAAHVTVEELKQKIQLLEMYLLDLKADQPGTTYAVQQETVGGTDSSSSWCDEELQEQVYEDDEWMFCTTIAADDRMSACQSIDDDTEGFDGETELPIQHQACYLYEYKDQPGHAAAAPCFASSMMSKSLDSTAHILDEAPPPEHFLPGTTDSVQAPTCCAIANINSKQLGPASPPAFSGTAEELKRPEDSPWQPAAPPMRHAVDQLLSNEAAAILIPPCKAPTNTSGGSVAQDVMQLPNFGTAGDHASCPTNGCSNIPQLLACSVVVACSEATSMPQSDQLQLHDNSQVSYRAHHGGWWSTAPMDVPITQFDPGITSLAAQQRSSLHRKKAKALTPPCSSSPWDALC